MCVSFIGGFKMLKKFTACILFILVSFCLFACNKNDKKSTVSISTGSVECDKYLTLINELQAQSKIPSDSEKNLEASIEIFKEQLRKHPESTKRECNSAYTALRAAAR